MITNKISTEMLLQENISFYECLHTCLIDITSMPIQTQFIYIDLHFTKKEVYIHGYYMLQNHSSNRLSGVVAICLRDDVRFIPRQSIFVEISKDVLGTRKNVVIGITYRMPNK